MVQNQERNRIGNRWHIRTLLVDRARTAGTGCDRARAPERTDVGNAAAFLLSPRSSGINAQGIVIDAGMEVNYFDKRIVERFVGHAPHSPQHGDR